MDEVRVIGEHVKKVFIIISFQLILIEIMCFVFLSLYLYPQYSRLFWTDHKANFDNITPEFVSAYGGVNRDIGADVMFDAELGWDTIPGIFGINKTGCDGKEWTFSLDSNASRNTTTEFDKQTPFVSLYGDSFTFGSEVNDDQTWQHYLEEAAGFKVQNFGVGGYGPDQALFKLERNLERGIKTPVIILGIFSAGIPRVLSSFRPFNIPNAGLKLGFKPSLFRAGSTYEKSPNPLIGLEDNQLLDAFETASESDYHYAINQKKPRYDFPYSITMLKTIKYLLIDLDRESNYWMEGHEANSRMYEIARRFVELSRKDNFSPVILFIPQANELQGYATGKAPAYAEYFKRLEQLYEDLILIDVLKEDFDPSRFALPGCHSSDYGNSIMGKTVYKYMKQHNILP